MDKRRQSILKQDGRIPLQETVLPDFPEEDTATVTVTKSRRVSFGANIVKEFIVGSAVSAQFFSEYEQAVSSSDSSNQNTSRSEIMDQSTFQSEGDALNLCVKQVIEDEIGPLRKKFCSEKLNSYPEISDRNNENIWDFNVSNASNIFADKNVGCSNKTEMLKNNMKCSKKASPFINSSIVDKQLQNIKNESGLNSSKLDETIEKKSKIGKFSSTIFFSADSPTADVEFTEGCISLAKSIFDKKKKEMTVYIKGTPKESKKEGGRDGSNTVVFESDDSDVGMKLTGCVDESEAESDLPSVNFSKFFPSPKGVADSSDDFDESHENIENIPLHMYSLNTMLGRSENSQVDAEMERSLFFPERSLTEMLCSDPLKTTTSDVSSTEQDDTEECDMEISSPNVLKTAIIDEGLRVCGGMEETGVNNLANESASVSCHPPDEGGNDCTSPIFSKVSVGHDLSLTSEDSIESGLVTADPLKMLVCEDITQCGDPDLDLSECSHLKITSSFNVREDVIMDGRDRASNTLSPSVEGRNLSTWKEESEECHFLDDSHEKSSAVTSFLDENKKSREIASPSMTETLRCSLSNNDVEEMVNVERVENVESQQLPEHKKRDSDSGSSEIPMGAGVKGSGNVEEPWLTASGINWEVDVPISATEEASLNSSVPDAKQEVNNTALDFRPSGHVCESEMNLSKSYVLSEATELEPEVADVGAKESSFREDEQDSSEFGPPKSAIWKNIPSSEDKKEVEPENREMSRDGGDDGKDHEMEASACELNIVKDNSSTNVERTTSEVEEFQGSYVFGQHERSCLQETRFAESSFSSRSFCDGSDRTSLGDKKILDLLTDQSEESNCCWKIDSIDRAGDINLWNFSIPILKNSAIMKFKLRPPKEKSLFSFSFVLDCCLELQESKEYQLEKDRIGIAYAFGKLKSYFQRESRGLDNVHKMPLFLDKINLIMKKMNGILRQLIRILKEYPGSQLKESILSFRIYSFPLLFSYVIEIDVSDPFQLSENSVAVKKQFGDFNTARLKPVFEECLRKEEPLTRYITKLTESVVGMEREIGFITKRSHIRLIS